MSVVPTSPMPHRWHLRKRSPVSSGSFQLCQVKILLDYLATLCLKTAWPWRGYEFLDTELERVVRDATIGRRYADKLVKVFVREGQETWLLIHVEIQGYPDPDFAQRMFVYYYRIFDRYDVEVVSLAVLTGEVPARHVAPYRRARWGCELRFRFPAVTVRHWGRRWAALEQHANPFAVVVMAHLKARQVRPGEARKQWKLRLMRGLYERGRSREEILALFRFIDWLLVLPAALEQAFWQELRQVEEAHRMPYVTSVERFGIQQGLQQGLEQGLQQGLEQGQLLEARAMVLEAVAAQFGAVPEEVVTAVQRVESRDTLHTLLRQAIACPTLEEFRAVLGAVQS